MSKHYLAAEVFAETLPHVQNQTAIQNESSSQHPADVVAPQLAKRANFRRKSSLLTVAACALAIPGLLTTVAVPAYGAMIPSAPGSTSASASPTVSALAPQSLTTGSTVVTSGGLARETVKYVAPRVHVLTRWEPTVPVDSSRIVAIAKRYLGVPYKFGGESPAGFDCSGLVAYVYAQVGIRLPHSALEQGEIGHRVSVADAVPGDVVVMNGGAHVGIYVGDNEMIDAPEPGRRVSVDKIYDNDYFIVRF